MGIKGFLNKLKFRNGKADCAEYFDLVQVVLDNESTPEQETYLRRHLDRCLKCLNHVTLEEELKEALRQKTKYHEVQAGLAESIREKIAQS